MNMLSPRAGDLMARGAEGMSRVMEQARLLSEVAGRQAATLLPQLAARPKTPPLDMLARGPMALWQDMLAYAVDAGQRSILFWDTLREAGNNFIAHENAGCPPVLVFEYDTVLDGRSLPRPVNYALVRIKPPEGGTPTDPKLRPFVIVDPRAGHGAGIGGFKSDSQVGVALKRGHPVYFVVFYRDPEPGQTIIDVTRAEAAFLRAVLAAHPEAPRPVVIGNCQGGWAVMMLGAAQPELVGALVLNGAPLSYWAGEKGKNPMRYSGGLAGGSWPAAMLADLGGGRFDGANLVLNFESLSPANTWFRKYYDLYAKIDTEAPRFLEFERWWGGFFLMNRDEIRWIVENLFIGNRFARGEIAAGQGQTFNMRNVRSPVIVFASSGDNITPPGQALRWISDVYRDEREIRTLGQTIVYLVHHDIGHLGIFVSAKIARKEHAEIASTLEVIEAVAPGLYELVITEQKGEGAAASYEVELVERRMEELRALCGEAENQAFPAVARLSALNQGLYDMFVAPLLRQMVTEETAELRRRLHPLRLRRTLVSDLNPFLFGLHAWANAVRAARTPADHGNVFHAMEQSWADAMTRAIDIAADLRDAGQEMAFHMIFGAMAALDQGVDPVAAPAALAAQDLTEEPEVAAAVTRVEQGGFAEAVVRMMLLLAAARGGVRRSRLARSSAVLQSQPPFDAMSAAARQALIREQAVITEMTPDAAIAALPGLLPDAEERARAFAIVAGVAGPEDELGESARAMLHRLRDVLGLAAEATA
jgi:pimeloyl-ACP methyl ester carboxylesterase/tellurite resistance protein